MDSQQELNEHIIAKSLSDLESVVRSRLFGSCAAATLPFIWRVSEHRSRWANAEIF